MAFPDDPTDLKLWFALDADLSADPSSWTFDTDVSEDAQLSAVITRGRLGEQTRVQPTKVDAAVANPDGIYSPRNVSGTYFGRLRRNTPMQVTVERQSGTFVRATAQIPDWPVQWTAPDTDERVPLSTAGILRRLGQGDEAASAVKRTALGANNVAPVAYWPLEDGADATVIASGLADGTPLSVVMAGTSPATVGSIEGPPGSGTAITCQAGIPGSNQTRLVGQKPSSAGETYLSVELWTKFGLADAPADAVTMTAGLINLAGGDTGVTGLQITGLSASMIVQVALADGNLTTFLNPSTDLDDDQWHHVQLTLTQNGADVDVELVVDGQSVDSDTLSAQTIGVLDRVILTNFSNYYDGASAAITTEFPAIAVSHAAMYHDDGQPDLYEAGLGYVGELAADRAARVCAEEGVHIDVAAGDSVAMGVQPIGTLPQLLDDCEETDEGQQVERFSGALGFDPHTAYENQPVALTLDYELGEVTEWEPVDDDQAIINRMTISRPSGSSATVEQTGGSLGSDPQTGVGLYADAGSRNVAADDQLVQHASYAVGRGTVDKMRFRRVKVDLIGHPDLIDAWLDCDIGSRVAILNGPPEHVGPNDLDLILRGYVEELDAVTWNIYLDLDPYDIYGVSEIADVAGDTGEFVGHLAGDPDAAIRVAIDDNDTSIEFDPNRFRWTTTADHFDPDLEVRFGGETAEVSSISTTAVTYVAAGAASHADNAAVTPAIFAGATTRDGIFVLAAIRSSGTGTLLTPTGYTRLPVFEEDDNVQLFFKVHDGSEPDPTVTPSGGSAGDTVSAFTFGFRGTPVTLDDPADIVVLAHALLNSSAQNIAYHGIFPFNVAGCVILLIGWKQDDYTSVAVPSGFTEALEASTTTGSDQSLYLAYRIQTTPAGISQSSLAVTGGASAISRSAMVALAAGYQTMTVSARNTNGISGGKSHAAGTKIEVANPHVLGL